MGSFEAAHEARLAQSVEMAGLAPEGGATGSPEPSEPDTGGPERVGNPYTPGRAVVSPAMFFGRTAELAVLLQRVEAGKHTAVVGPADIGISSLLRRLASARPHPPGMVMALIDLSDPRYLTPDSLAQGLWAQWWGEIRPGYVPSIDGLSVLEPLARRLAAAGHRLVAILDEYEQLVWRIEQFDGAFHTLMAGLAADGIVTFVTGTHMPLAELFQQTGVPGAAYGAFTQFDVGLLEEPEALQLLTEPPRRAGFEMADGEVAHFVDLAGAHPLFLHLAGTYLYAALQANAYDRERVEQQFRAAAEPHWQELWSALPPPARATLGLEGLAADDAFAARQQRNLHRKGLMLGEGPDARLFSRGFADWARGMIRATQLGREATTEN